MTSSGLTHAGARDRGNSHRIKNSYTNAKNFGVININWNNKAGPEVTLQIHHLAKNTSTLFRSHSIQFQ